MRVKIDGSVAVVTGASNPQRVEILQGLLPGDRVVTEGAYALKARKLKSQLGHGH